jgi:Xaa-Pro aminopeptidase
MKYKTIESAFFVANRKRLAEKLKPGSIAVLFASYQMPRNGNQHYPYRQNSDFFYLTGIEQEKSIIVLSPDSMLNDHKEILFILHSNKILEKWDGHKLAPEEASATSGIKTIKYLDEFDSIMHMLITACENMYFNIPENPKFQSDVLSRDQYYASTFRNEYPLHNFERLAPLMQQLRLIKTEIEIDLIKQATRITKNAFLSVLKELKPGMKEYELEALISYEFCRHGASGSAYIPIIACGKNACVLHYVENNCTCDEAALLLMDFGAEYANYAADLSRTIPVNGKYNKRQREMYGATLRIFKYARDIIKSGTTITKIHDEVCKIWEEEHIHLGLYSRQDSKNHDGENALWFNYYMHGTSHFLGLDVHDVGALDTVIEPGMVLTCEPGIYVTEEGIGIRIENDLLVTKTGNIDLMEDIPIEVEEIEALMHHR